MSEIKLRILMRKTYSAPMEMSQFGEPNNRCTARTVSTIPVLQILRKTHSGSIGELGGIDIERRWEDVPIVEDDSPVVSPTPNTNQTIAKPAKTGYWIVEHIDKRLGKPTDWYLSIVPKTFNKTAPPSDLTYLTNILSAALKFYDEEQAKMAADYQQPTLSGFWQVKYCPHTQDDK